MNRILRLRDGSQIDLLGIGVLAVVLATIAIGIMVIAPAVSMYRHPPAAPTATRDAAAAARKHGDALAWQQQQVAGRSMFYKPLPPDHKDEPTTVAKYYGGPTLLAFVNGTAWFSDGQKVSAKEPDGKTVHFVSARPPWSVKVRWEGGEFDVKLFDKTEFSSLSSSSALSATSSYPSLGSSTTSPTSGTKPGEPASSHTTQPPEARLGPGAGSGSESPPPPPPPPSGAAGGPGPGGGGEPPSPGASPAPAPAPSPAPSPAPPSEPAPSQPSPPPTPPSDPQRGPNTSQPTGPSHS